MMDVPFLRRATLEELSLLTYAEAHLAFVEACDAVDDLNVSADALKWLNHTSYGHPHLMQLLGFFAIENLKLRDVKVGYTLGIDDLTAIEPIAMAEYNRRLLKPMVSELSSLVVEYLKAMSNSLDADRLASLDQVATMIEQPAERIDEACERLVGDGIIALPERGKVMFCVPYLSKFIMSDLIASDIVAVARSRRV